MRAPGMKGVFGAPGAYVPGSDLTLKVAAIRGVESRGMMCSVRELELGDEHEGIIELPDDAPVGAAYAQWAGLDDPVIDVAVTPNRQDCMGVHGIARDLAAAGLGTLKPIEVRADRRHLPLPDRDPHRRSRGLPRFLRPRRPRRPQRPLARLAAAKAEGGRASGRSAPWSTSPIIIMLSYGRPLHVYDLARLEGAIVARRARDGEEMLALNGKHLSARPDDDGDRRRCAASTISAESWAANIRA